MKKTKTVPGVDPEEIKKKLPKGVRNRIQAKVDQVVHKGIEGTGGGGVRPIDPGSRSGGAGGRPPRSGEGGGGGRGGGGGSRNGSGEASKSEIGKPRPEKPQVYGPDGKMRKLLPDSMETQRIGMPWITATLKKNGTPLAINLNQVLAIAPDGDGSSFLFGVEFGGKPYNVIVRESFDEIGKKVGSSALAMAPRLGKRAPDDRGRPKNDDPGLRNKGTRKQVRQIMDDLDKQGK